MRYNGSSHPPNCSDEQQILLKAIKHISRNFGDTIDLARLANNVGLTEQGLDSLFQKYKGKSAADALLDCRLKALCDRLGSQPHQPIEDLIADCGLSTGDETHSTFERIFGITIEDYRRQYHAIAMRNSI